MSEFLSVILAVPKARDCPINKETIKRITSRYFMPEAETKESPTSENAVQDQSSPQQDTTRERRMASVQVVLVRGAWRFYPTSYYQ